MADATTLHSLQLLAQNLSFDEQPCLEADASLFQLKTIETILRKGKGATQPTLKKLGLATTCMGKPKPSNGCILLFDPHRYEHFPDAVVRCVRFQETTRAKILDQQDIIDDLIPSVDQIIGFVDRNTRLAAEIGAVKRRDISEYPQEAVREAIINALLHADYAIKGTSIQIAIFSDRLEITNPGGLPFGQRMEYALAGASKMRNPVIGKVFRRAGLVEKLGSGIQRIYQAYKQEGTVPPKFEELGKQFRVTLYSRTIRPKSSRVWEEAILKYLAKGEGLTTKEIAQFWKVSDRTARNRLKELVDLGLVQRVGTSPKDPKAKFFLTISSSTRQSNTED